jgi:hypothetical protein
MGATAPCATLVSILLEIKLGACMQDLRYLDMKLGQMSEIADKALGDLDYKIDELSRNITALEPGAAQVQIPLNLSLPFHI